MAPTILGKYEIRGVLGRGAAGIVYDAWDPVIARRVAIKTVKLPTADDPETEEELGRFRREAQAAGRLSHPNIVPVFDYAETDEIAYIVMEFVGGGSLQALMKEANQVPLPEVQRIMEQLLSGLQFSHDRGIVHRDIKPANVMLSSDNTIKITDFGIARIEGSGGATIVGTMLGTPAYMSPEQWRGDAIIDARSDIYAAGVMLYHMLTGRRPFEGGNQSAIMHKVLNSEFDPPSVVLPSLPVALDAVVQKAMARAPADRYNSAADFAAALKRAMAGGAGADDDEATLIRPARQTAARPAPGRATTAPAASGKSASGKSAPGKPARNTGVLIGAVVAVLVVGGGGAWLLSGGKPTQPAVTPGSEASGPAVVPPDAPRAAAPSDPAARPFPAPDPAARPPPAPDLARPIPAPPAAPSVREALAAAPCSAVYGEMSPARLTLRGILPQSQYATVRASFDQTQAQSRSWDVQPLPTMAYYCQVLDTLRPVLRGPGDQTGVLARLLPSPANGSLRLVENDPIDFDVTGPDYSSVLQVDYIDNTGKVSHYMPRKTAPILNVRRLKPAEHVRLFDAAPGASFQVGPPPGIDLVVIVASSEPLQAKYTKDDDESVTAYLAGLRTALDAARRKGVRLSVELVPVESMETPAKP